MFEVVWKFKNIENDAWNTTLIYGDNKKDALGNFVLVFKHDKIVVKEIRRVE